MTNKETAKILLELANVYGTTPDSEEVPSLQAPSLHIYATSKEQVISIIRCVGRKFIKRTGYGGDTMYYDSQRILGVSIWISRDKVCRMIPASYECEPLLSVSDEAEIVEDGA